MKKFIFYLSVFLSLTVLSCQKEKAGQIEEKPLVFSEVSVDIGQEDYSGSDTKSQISIKAEKLQKAMLFAFQHSNGKIIVNAGVPVIKETDSKNFSWALPLNVQMDIYVIANYGDLDLSGCLTNTSMTKADLEGLTFSCVGTADLKKLELDGYGLPMAGIKKDVTMTAGNTALSLKVKKLFARYDFYFDATAFADAGYTINSLYISASKSNTEVPYFVEGFGQTELSKLKLVDLGTAEDIAQLNYASRDHAVTLYFLENCQGNKTGVDYWYQVAGSGMPGLNLCSYIDLGIKATDAEGNDSNFYYWIYLGDDCKSNFDIRRNEYRTIKMTLRTPDVVPPTQGISIISAESILGAVQPSHCRLYFETTLSESELTLSSSKNDIIASLESFSLTNAKGRTAYPHSGYIDVAVADGHNISEAIDGVVTVGKWNSNTWQVSDQREVSFAAYVPTVSYRLTRMALSSAAISYGGTSTATVYRQKYVDGVATGSEESISAGSFDWSSSATGVATVNASGVVTGVSGGTSTIKAVLKSSASDYAKYENTQATASITVSNVTTYAYTKLVISGDSEVYVGATTGNYSATLYTQAYVNGVATGEATTSDVSGSVTFSSSDTGKATMSGRKATGVAAGTTYISGSYSGTYGTVTTASADRKQLTVKANVVTHRLAVTPASSSVMKGETVSLVATYYTTTNGVEDSGVVVTTDSGTTWTRSSGSSNVSVNNSSTNKGKVTATSYGTAVIKASYMGVEATASVAFSAYQFRLKPATSDGYELGAGYDKTMKVYRYLVRADGTVDGESETLMGNDNFTWISSSAAATVDTAGKVHGVKAGTVAITATMKVGVADYSKFINADGKDSSSIKIVSGSSSWNDDWEDGGEQTLD